MDRRSFFGLLGAGAATLQVKSRLTTGPLATEHSVAKVSIDHYTSDAFAPLVGRVFSFHRTADANDSPVRLELVEVQSSTRQSRAGARQPFSLLFALRSGDATEESTLHLRHDAFEPCPWFVNRVVGPKSDPKTPYYEAIFG
jgi:uncharacterized protein DUF6916